MHLHFCNSGGTTALIPLLQQGDMAGWHCIDSANLHVPAVAACAAVGARCRSRRGGGGRGCGGGQRPGLNGMAAFPFRSCLSPSHNSHGCKNRFCLARKWQLQTESDHAVWGKDVGCPLGNPSHIAWATSSIALSLSFSRCFFTVQLSGCLLLQARSAHDKA